MASRNTTNDVQIEALCREAATNAGHDPDERVARDGAKSWPTNLNVKGNLDFSNQEIISLPDNLTVAGDLMLDDCKLLMSLPNKLKVKGNLYLNRCTSLVHIPDNVVANAIYMSACAAIEYLPDTFGKASNLVLTRCTALKKLPVGIRPNTSIFINGCTSLLSGVKNCVFTRIFMFSDGIIRTSLYDDELEWFRDNGITLRERSVKSKPYKISTQVIDDPAEYMHYRLKWG